MPTSIFEQWLIGDIVQIIADVAQLWADSQHVIADPLDQSRLPAGRHGARDRSC
jgi:hypothetical protein